MTRASPASPLGFATSTKTSTVELEAALRGIVEVTNPWSFQTGVV